MTWSAAQYTRFEEDRTRPVRDLLAAVPDSAMPGPAGTGPRHLVDLGCGPGNSTELLQARFPGAATEGVDTSADMLDAARKRLPQAVFHQADIATWSPHRPVDVILANASLHWVPDHAALFPRLLRHLAPGGSLAVQMPDNMTQPSQRAMDDTAADPAWAGRIAAAAGFRAQMLSAAGYIDLLSPLVTRLDVWTTTYMHILPGGPDAIVEWFKGSGLRPFLAPLTEQERDGFLAQYRARIAAAYPTLGDGSVVLPFPRLFIVATI